MAPTDARQHPCRRLLRGGAVALVAAAAVAAAGLADVWPAAAQTRGIIAFPKRPQPEKKAGPSLLGPQARNSKEQMLVRADTVNYDYVNERVAAVGNVQIYHSGATLEADRVIYDQKTKRLHAEGNVRLAEADGRVTYGEILNLSDDFRDGFVDSLRLDLPEQTRFAATRADRQSGNLTVFQNGVYTACEPCKDDPRKPPKWQVKAARVIHDQGEKMMYFEGARLEFFGVPLVYLPYFSTPDPSAKRKTGFLVPTFGTNSKYGFSVTTPYYWALAPNYDFTLTPVITSAQGPVVIGEWRHRLVDGAYDIRASGIFQLDKEAFGSEPGNREFRGHVSSAGQFRLSDQWVWGWDGTAITDKAYFQDYGLFRSKQSNNLLSSTPDYVLSQGYLAGRGDKSWFDARALYFYGFSSVDNQQQIPIVHPVIDSDYTFRQPIFGGEVNIRSNLTSLNRDAANFDPITSAAANGNLCGLNTADPAVKIPANCLLRGVPGNYSRASSEASWRSTIVDSAGQMFTPFVSMRADIASVDVSNQAGVSNYINPGQNEVARFMPTAGVEYRYPFINVQSWGTQTIQPIAQIILRPNETSIGSLPNEDAQSFSFEASNLFRINKFGGWDRVEGGGRANVGVQYTAQFNQGGFVNAIFGQSYHLFGLNSFAVGGTTNTGLSSGLDTSRSDYVASASYQPNATFTITSRFRFDESDFTLQRSEYEATFNFDRWTTTILYGNYSAQPLLGFLDRREGVVGSARYKVNPNWLLLGGARYDLRTEQLTQTQVGVGYIDDCLILAMNYITEYNYNSTQRFNHTVLLQLSLRTLGGTSVSQGLTGLGATSSTSTPGHFGIPGL
jgi:LPS-assembly protein